MSSALAALALTLCTGSGARGEDVPAGDDALVPARPLEMNLPGYPRRLQLLGVEGWVELKFVVQADGGTRDVAVIDSSGEQAFERAAVVAARRFRFEPAQLNGNPVEETVASLRIDFAGDDILAVLGRGAPELRAAGWGMRRTSGDHYRLPKPIELNEPDYPRNMSRREREGWVLVSYVIATDGSVRDVVVVDSTGEPAFERAAVEAVRKFRHEPALLKGEPVEHTVPLFKMIFTLQGGTSAASGAFVREYKAVDRHIRRGELDRAARALETMRELPRYNLYEDASYWWIRAAYEGAVGNHNARRESLLRAIAYQDEHLALELRINAYELLYADYVRTGEFVAAMDAYDKLSKVLYPASPSPPMSEHVASLRAAIAGQDVLKALGYIGDSVPWAHILSRDWLEISNIEGRLDRFSVWCRYRARELEITGEAAWYIPPDWGPCRIYVYGEPGTTFHLWEYDDESAEP